VLIVEDDDDGRALVAKVLQGQGAQVNVVASAREALDVPASERVDATHRD
jgi:CheY-like chemotaxis protein